MPAQDVDAPRGLELFAGGGGMALGVSQAGFQHAALVECDPRACDTLRANAAGRWSPDAVHQADVRQWLRSPAADDLGAIDLLAGGPPCQPFSLGGVHAGQSDSRNMFPAALDAVRRFAPKAVIFENVPGLLRPSFRPYFDYVAAQLREPTVLPRTGEPWREHAARVVARARGQRSLRYRVPEPVVVNAADLGVAQTRRRVFLVAIRDDLSVDWPGVEPTHSQAALLYDQWVEPIYWERHGIAAPPPPAWLTEERLRRLKLAGRPGLRRWQTVRDLLRTPVPLPPAVGKGRTPNVANHVTVPGARAYPGHTGSALDLPAKTIKAGVHGVCGGEAMIRFPNGTLRYLTVRESARAQGFPDDYVFPGARSTAMRHIGNAVAVDVARAIGLRLSALLFSG